jgi:hypothetical protein
MCRRKCARTKSIICMTWSWPADPGMVSATILSEPQTKRLLHLHTLRSTAFPSINCDPLQLSQSPLHWQRQPMVINNILLLFLDIMYTHHHDSKCCRASLVSWPPPLGHHMSKHVATVFGQHGESQRYRGRGWRPPKSAPKNGWTT